MPDTDPQDPQVPEGFFTKEQLEVAIKEAKQAARGEARDQLHTRLERTAEQQKTMEAELKELRAAEKLRADAETARQKEIDDARKAQEEAELSWQQKIEKRNAEFESQLARTKQESDAQIEAMRAEQAQREALFTKEREFAALQLYITNSAAAHANDIAPELIDLIDGNSTEEVDASVARLVEKTASIVQGMRQAAQAQRAAMPGVSPGGGTAGIVPGLDTGDKQLSAQDIAGMSMKDFAALRGQIGLAARGQGQGIFG